MAKEHISALMDTVDEKCAVILGSKHFMSILSDSSQGRKKKWATLLYRCVLDKNGKMGWNRY